MRQAKAKYLNRITDSWTEVVLTLDHPSSSYGQPVLVADDVAYGPADVLPGTRIGNSPAESRDDVTAADWVDYKRNYFSPMDDDPSVFVEDDQDAETSAAIDGLISRFCR